MNFKLLFLDNLGGGELLIVVFFVLLFFGSEKIPGLMRGLGRAMREFKTAMDDVKQDIESSVNEPVSQLKDAVEISIKEPTNSISRNINTVINEIETKDKDDKSDSLSK
jgi:sec-independent protein translocase protein TatA